MQIKSVFCILSALAVCTLSSCAKPEWQLVWSDEFNADTLNTAWWNVEDNARGGGNAELQYYTPNNISFERHPATGESCLVLNAKRENYRNRPCTSARLNTEKWKHVSHSRTHKMAYGLLFGCWGTTLPRTWVITMTLTNRQHNWPPKDASFGQNAEK